MKKSIFKASFEESLNLLDDSVSGKYAEDLYQDALKKEKYRGTFKSYVVSDDKKSTLVLVGRVLFLCSNALELFLVVIFIIVHVLVIVKKVVLWRHYLGDYEKENF